MKKILALSCFLLGLVPARALITETFDFNGLNLNIPDGDPSGLANVQNFATTIQEITDVEVSLHLVATPDADPQAFNGDFYVYLTHGTGFSVLLNRVGRTSTNSFGYDDNGFDIVLDDNATNNVHTYQDITASASPLTGTWQPDARITDPDNVFATDTPNAFLASFNGLSAAGDWTLFVADVSTGEQHQLADWSLTITGIVPEPGTWVMTALGGGFILYRLLRRKTA